MYVLFELITFSRQKGLLEALPACCIKSIIIVMGTTKMLDKAAEIMDTKHIRVTTLTF